MAKSTKSDFNTSRAQQQIEYGLQNEIIRNGGEAWLMEYANENTAKQFEFNATEAQKERDWSERMSNTSHQREVKDLIRAGLNPVLSANGGAAAYAGAQAKSSVDSATGALSALYQQKMANQNAREIADAQIANNWAMNQASIQAQKYVSDQSYAASVYAANMGLAQASTYAAATRYAAGAAAAAQMYAADQNYAASKYSTDYSKNGSWSGLFGSWLQKGIDAGVQNYGGNYHNGRGEN